MSDVNMSGTAKIKLSEYNKSKAAQEESEQTNIRELKKKFFEQAKDTIRRMSYADTQEMMRILNERGVIVKRQSLLSRACIFVKKIVVRR